MIGGDCGYSIVENVAGTAVSSVVEAEERGGLPCRY
jgi:hypothetical protein